MRILVTGAAGFIGSHLSEKLLSDEDNEVIGMDAFVNTTPKWIRERNLRALLHHPRFEFKEQHLLEVNWDEILPKVDAVYHLAGIPGVRSSWGPDFSSYVTNNIVVTQQMLEGCRKHSVHKFIYASTSSVYGERTGQVSESAVPAPLSPYGVSKLTGEHLCRVYYENDGIPIIILRFFTVYGPRQRPDMAFHRFIHHILHHKPIPIYGDGKQTRDFTYIDDCVKAAANVLYAENVIGETMNIGGKERASIIDIMHILEELFERKIAFEFAGPARGEPKHTWADISKAQKLLHYEPIVNLRSGIAKEMNDLRQLYNDSFN
ncbi:NAD-dependent epimerase/dehydratase family protein [Paenibacillus sediminis]|uniref:Nucleoside-diphosphate-sugar epimerase n=1 Tax=Paenibacillus sediminis TaxID=664909 RepID=A0ABS4H737_9BACL|nr:NAD-dependent epimerase/dehydratase family protein [Paenibacillus sediminis]MBP1937870.1 nucleoside-diphosphate-sugar epimerase [Paenibacillus sediminis]